MSTTTSTSTSTQTKTRPTQTRSRTGKTKSGHKPEPTLAIRVGAVLTSRRWELFLLSVLMWGVFCLASLAGASPADPTLFDGGVGRVENPCGPVGAHLAWLLHALLGYGAWGIVVPMALGVLRLAGRGFATVAQWIGAFGGYLVMLASLELALGPGEWFHPGGLVGLSIAWSLQIALGPLGAVLALCAGTVVALTVALRIHWGAILARVADRVEAWGPVASEVAGRGARGAATAGSAAARGGMGVLAALARAAGRAVASVTRFGVGGVLGVVRAIASTIGGALGRMGSSLARGPEQTLDWEHGELPPESMPGAVWDLGLPREGDTQVSIPMGIVEVQWDTTSHSQEDEAVHDVLALFPDFGVRSSVDEPVPTALDAGTETGTLTPPEESADACEDEPDDDLDEDDDDQDADDDEASPLDAPPPSIRVQRPKPVAKVGATPGLGVQVHRAAFLDEKVEDDGEAVVVAPEWQLPPLSVLDDVPEQEAAFDEFAMRRLATIVEQKLLSFKIGGRVLAVRPGPVVTVFEFEPVEGIKVSRISALEDDLAMALKALSVRIVAPIPGKGCVGIEIPSQRRLTIYLREILAAPSFRTGGHSLPCILGKDVEGKPVVADLTKMPHLLIGGTTGSGKSVGVNGMLMSLLFTRTPEELRLLLIDPKMLEFELYDGIPHLLHPVVTEPKKAQAALEWACREMDRRYSVLARWGTRSIRSYNDKVAREVVSWTPEKARKLMSEDDWLNTPEGIPHPERMPYIVIVVDELADLMMTSGKEVEESIVRIAQKARACGIHLVVATQRPSVDVITGLIKANLPTRICFQLRTKIDSRTVLDQGGAETLLGRGDMLYLPPGVSNLQRCHGPFVSDNEVARVTDYLRAQADPDYVPDLTRTDDDREAVSDEEKDDLYYQALEVVVKAGKASTSMIQRHLKIGYNRAARIIDILEAEGVVGPPDGARPREVLLSGPG